MKGKTINADNENINSKVNKENPIKKLKIKADMNDFFVCFI